MSWSEKRKEYFIKLFPDYRLGFLLMNISKGVDLRHHNMSDYDYIVIQSDFYRCYILFKANLHIGKQSISLEKTHTYIRKNELTIVSKSLGHDKLYEKCLVIPYGREDKISKDLSYYFIEVVPINHKQNMVYGFYNAETQLIESIK